ncbi:IS3 family transposase [Aneurinibacillus aneurinilyticus]|uniref:IS3 family transposase n=1 Tax=Aneurinibacillus aneurinilyticus TaxID=1391 RepID=UPI0009DBDE12
MESFYSVLKKELIYLETCPTRAEAKKRIFEYIVFLQWKENLFSARVLHTQSIRAYVPFSSVIPSIPCVQSIDRGPPFV